MNIEQLISDELRELGAAVRPPPAPDPDALVRQAEQARTRTVLRSGVTVLLAAAAVLAAVAIGNHFGDPKAAPDPSHHPTRTAEGLTVGEPLRTWVDRDGRLHLDGVQVPGKDWADAVTTGDLTTVEQGPYDTGETALFLGTKLVGRIHQVLVHEIRVSPDHRTIAWVRFDDARRSRASIAVGRVSDAGVEELGRLPLASLALDNDNEGHESLFSVADDGTVLYGGVVGGHSWKPGGSPRRADVSAYLYRPSGFPETDDALDIRLDPSGTWGAWPTDEGKVVPGGEVTYRSVAYQRRNEPGSRSTFAFSGTYAYVNLLYWESDTDLILFASKTPAGVSGKGEYLRCSVVERTCQIAPEPSGR